ncbi:uncharacterized protein LOC117104991 [Anneissia japonica]|uniref:uncharacterized protein LOC117104991 n=1 Tax=Anneissia japonica TaxID=1529436 RepID=UPI0014259D41|nr:uncharacterized protein LOC117104991 [Anneissia japonica]
MDQSNVDVLAGRAGDDIVGHRTQPAVASNSCSYPWFYTIYLVVLIVMTILPLMGIGSFLFIYPSYILALLLFILVAQCQRRNKKEPNGKIGIPCENVHSHNMTSTSMTSSRPTAENSFGTNRMWLSLFMFPRGNVSSIGGHRGTREKSSHDAVPEDVATVDEYDSVNDVPPSYFEATSDGSHYLSVSDHHETDGYRAYGNGLGRCTDCLAYQSLFPDFPRKWVSGAAKDPSERVQCENPI